METQSTLQPEPAPQASPVPPAFGIPIWVMTFAGVLWGMFYLFGIRPGQSPSPPPLGDPERTHDPRTGSPSPTE